MAFSSPLRAASMSIPRFFPAARLLALCRLGEGGETLRAHCAVAPGEPGHKQRCEMAFGELLYRLFSQVTGYRPKWGVLTGVRPVKNIRRRLDGGMGEADLRRLFCGEYRVSEQKFDLALQTARVQERAPVSYTHLTSPNMMPKRRV